MGSEPGFLEEAEDFVQTAESHFGLTVANRETFRNEVACWLEDSFHDGRERGWVEGRAAERERAALMEAVVEDLRVSVEHGAYFCQCGVPEGGGLTHVDGVCPYCVGERGLAALRTYLAAESEDADG